MCGSRPPLVEQEVEQVRTIIGTMREHNEQYPRVPDYG